MAERQYPVVPLEHGDPVLHRRQIAQRCNAAIVPVIESLADGQVIMWDGEAWKNVGGSGSWTPALQFGGGTTGITYDNRSGFYYRVGELVYIQATFKLTSKGSDTGSATIGGMPLSVKDTVSDVTLDHMASVPLAINMSGLSSAITAGISHSPVEAVILYQWVATGAANISNSEFTDTSGMRIHGVYITDAD